MLDLYDEFLALVGALEREGAQYALCGGLAMAVHGFVRATIDIDLLVPRDQVDAARDACRRQGFSIEALPMSFAGGDVPIEQMTKADSSGSLLSVDLLVVTDATKSAWDSRTEVELHGVRLFVVSREGLVTLKRLRNNAQDRADIENLERPDER